jgi:hypothetical protein
MDELSDYVFLFNSYWSRQFPLFPLHRSEKKAEGSLSIGFKNEKGNCLPKLTFSISIYHQMTDGLHLRLQAY